MLVKELQTNGVEGDELVWFIDYLFGRFKSVAMNNVKSNKKPTYCVVPQGSILGLLLFIVFYDDFVDHLEYCNSSIQLGGVETFCLLGHILIWGY